MTKSAQIKLLVQEHLNGALFSVEHPAVSARGKVRDMIPQGDRMIMINTDRISAFDHVFGTIPLKGALLAEQAQFWFDFSKDIVPNHVIDRPDAQIFVVKKAAPFLVEVVVRGYLAGSLMREPAAIRGQAYGLRIDPSLKNYERLPEPIITPSTKAEKGAHDEPISPQALVARSIVTSTQWDRLQEIARELFVSASARLQKSGLLLVDTKYEFGLINGVIHLIDEVHTADSSRFFLAKDYEEKFPLGKTPTMLDKEFLRQYLLAHGLNPQANDFSHFTLEDSVREEVATRYFRLTETMTEHDFLIPKAPSHARVHEALEHLVC